MKAEGGRSGSWSPRPRFQSGRMGFKPLLQELCPCWGRGHGGKNNSRRQTPRLPQPRCALGQPLAAGIFQLELRVLPRCLFKICQKHQVRNNPAGVPAQPPAHGGHGEASSLPELSCSTWEPPGKGRTEPTKPQPAIGNHPAPQILLPR